MIARFYVDDNVGSFDNVVEFLIFVARNAFAFEVKLELAVNRYAGDCYLTYDVSGRSGDVARRIFDGSEVLGFDFRFEDITFSVEDERDRKTFEAVYDFVYFLPCCFRTY